LRWTVQFPRAGQGLIRCVVSLMTSKIGNGEDDDNGNNNNLLIHVFCFVVKEIIKLSISCTVVHKKWTRIICKPEPCRKILKPRVSGEGTCGASTNRTVSGLRYTGICPHKINMVLGRIFASSCITFYFTQSNTLCTAVLINPQQSTDITRVSLYEHDVNYIILIRSLNFSTINNRKKWKESVVHQGTWKLHLLHGLCVSHTFTSVLFHAV